MIELSKKMIELIATSRSRVAGYANLEMVVTYFEIGKNIVEEIQKGNKRADYGNQILIQVAEDLLLKLGKGFSVQNLERMRNFYLVYSKSSIELRKSPIFEKSSNELRISEKTTNL
ncbi:YhcG N-terminal domain-containing protein [Flavobacterium branchiophilum]|uniref:DUF1016 N-terminal domain-containing protein n=1 Tax=Flavobacterium branchiophilum TaxID=55197 RepID=UPI0005C6834B|nr:DUF1016 N-terminal domain-containing protein [Flavobacterium branchiophilum]